jgi:hypothetical protein
MTGPKERLSPEAYERWYARHKVTERKRQWEEMLAKNPINALDESDRGPLPETYSLVEAYWHPIDCNCGSCQGPAAKEAKELRMSERPIPAAVKSAGSRLPATPDLVLLRLQAVEERALSSEDQPRE